ncbi:MAG: hypothetical protein RMM58_10475 [Chloroflexota bacterium]|nr:hypothetical protein [Dehalococcoidia bacterium]MDW8254290.1 hypothetical protein [Chloroflexota bacterium]
MVETQAKPLPPPVQPDHPDRPASRRALDRGVLLAALLTLFAIGPLFYPGFFLSERGLIVPYEVVGLAERPSPTWLPRLADDPTLAQGPAPYWAARILLLAGLSPSGAVKAVFGGSLILAAVGVYILARRVVRAPRDQPEPVCWPALVAAAIVAALPALADALYVRGNLAEVWALGLLPFALWTSLAAARVVGEEREPDVPTIVIGAVLWAAIGLAHVGLMLAGLFVLAALRPRPEGWTGPAGGVVLAGAVWLVIAARHPITLGMPPAPPLDLAQVFAPPFSPAAARSLGPVAAILLLLSVAPLGVRRPAALALAAAALIALSLSFAAPIWQRLPALLSSPSQLLGVAGIALAVAGAQLVRALDLGRPMAATALAVMALVAGAPVFAAQPLAVREPTSFTPYLVDRDILLLEASLQAEDVRPGGTLTVVLVWQGRRPIGRDLTVFTHLQNSAHVVVAQHDGPPVEGKRPTSGWRPGEPHLDLHPIRIPSPLPPGRYQVVAGMYLPATGDRVGILAPNGRTSDAIMLGEIEIR